jgi:hypothetical protein
MKIGYARVSTLEQNLDLQTDALKKDGCEKIISDRIRGCITETAKLPSTLRFDQVNCGSQRKDFLSF